MNTKLIFDFFNGKIIMQKKGLIPEQEKSDYMKEKVNKALPELVTSIKTFDKVNKKFKRHELNIGITLSNPECQEISSFLEKKLKQHGFNGIDVHCDYTRTNLLVGRMKGIEDLNVDFNIYRGNHNETYKDYS